MAEGPTHYWNCGQRSWKWNELVGLNSVFGLNIRLDPFRESMVSTLKHYGMIFASLSRKLNE